jgi:hypothetical protein
VVVEDFAKPQVDRRVFTEVEKATNPMTLAREDYVLDHQNSSDQYQFYERSLDFEVVNEGGMLTFQDTTKGNNCVQDEERSTEDEWRGWCRHTGVANVEIYKSGRLVKALSANEFRDSGVFFPQLWTDNQTGEVRESGFVDSRGGKAAYMNWGGMSFSLDFDLGPGDYTLTVELASQVEEGFPDTDLQSASVLVRTENLDVSSVNAKAVAAQLEALHMRATGNILSDDMKNRLLEAFVDYASTTVSEEGTWFNGHCDFSEILDNSLMTNEESRRIRSDSAGSLRAWTLMVHALMNSYSYLHD